VIPREVGQDRDPAQYQVLSHHIPRSLFPETSAKDTNPFAMHLIKQQKKDEGESQLQKASKYYDPSQ